MGEHHGARSWTAGLPDVESEASIHLARLGQGGPRWKTRVRRRKGGSLISQQPAYIARIDEDDSAVVLSLVGEFDLAATELVRETLADALGTASHLVVDLSKTPFMDSAALGALIGAGNRARAAGGWLRLVAPHPRVRRLLQITAVDTVFGLYDTTDQAIAHKERAETADA